MHLIIIDRKNLLTDNFVYWLIERLKEMIISDLDAKKLSLWDNYFKEEKIYKSIYLKKISSKDIILCGANNLIFNKSQTQITVFIDANSYVPGLDQVKIADACKMINYGTLSQKGYPIFTNAFRQVEDNFNTFIDEYISVGV